MLRKLRLRGHTQMSELGRNGTLAVAFKSCFPKTWRGIDFGVNPLRLDMFHFLVQMSCKEWLDQVGSGRGLAE